MDNVAMRRLRRLSRREIPLNETMIALYRPSRLK